jgi:hypothetical protein
MNTFYELDMNNLNNNHLNILDLPDDMTSIISINSHKTFPIDTQVLSRICSNILPRIHSQVHKLTVEERSMKQILLAGKYAKFYSLSPKFSRKNTQYSTGIVTIEKKRHT